VLAAAASQGQTMAASLFDRPFGGGLNLFKVPRPPAGYTQLIHSFATDHPEFRLLAEHWPETNDTLRFNHQFHFTNNNIGLLNGKKLECNSCHKPDPTGAFHQQISFEANCKECHPLEFDSN